MGVEARNTMNVSTLAYLCSVKVTRNSDDNERELCYTPYEISAHKYDDLNDQSTHIDCARQSSSLAQAW